MQFNKKMQVDLNLDKNKIIAMGLIMMREGIENRRKRRSVVEKTSFYKMEFVHIN